jgi:hypothetical protein
MFTLANSDVACPTADSRPSSCSLFSLCPCARSEGMWLSVGTAPRIRSLAVAILMSQSLYQRSPFDWVGRTATARVRNRPTTDRVPARSPVTVPTELSICFLSLSPLTDSLSYDYKLGTTLLLNNVQFCSPKYSFAHQSTVLLTKVQFCSAHQKTK